MPKKISLNIGSNLNRYFGKNCTYNHAASVLQIDPSNYCKIRTGYDIKLSSVMKFATIIQVNLPVLFVNNAEYLFSIVFGKDIILPDNTDNKEDYQEVECEHKLQKDLRSYKVDSRTEAFISNFITNIEVTLKAQRKNKNIFYTIPETPKGWELVGNKKSEADDNNDVISRTVIHNLFVKKDYSNCLVSTLGWLALCCEYSWDDLAMLLVNNQYLELSKENKLVVKKEFRYNHLFKPAN